MKIAPEPATDKLPADCPKCGSRGTLSWQCCMQNLGGVTDGRICMREVDAMFYLACECCSETIGTLTGDKLAEIMTAKLNEGDATITLK